MTDRTSHDLDALSDDPADLDGHTIGELADYLDRGRTPPDPSIEGSPACLTAMAALARLRAVSASFLTAPGNRGDGEPDDTWVQQVMGEIAADARAGADFVLARTESGDEIVMTEGALRSVVRAAGDEEPGFLVGRVRFEGDLSSPPGPLTVVIDVVVAYGVVIPAAVQRLRTAVLERLELHTRFRGARIDVTVRDLMTDGGSR